MVTICRSENREYSIYACCYIAAQRPGFPHIKLDDDISPKMINMNNNCLVLEEGLEYYPVDLPRSIPYKAEFVVPLGSLPNNCFAE